MSDPTPADGRTRRFRLFRYRRGDGAPRSETFDVPVGASRTVLEGLRWIKVHADPELAIRHSCFHASCGTCGVRVNGREALACVAALDATTTSVTVEPMANHPVLADLVVDMGPFVDRFTEPHPLVRPVEPAAGPAMSPEGEPHERFEDCIECGLCLSACPVAATDDTYVGPAALAYAQSLLDRGEGDRDAILDWADGPGGAWRCHAAFECTEACPSDVRPAQRIMALRRELVRPRRRR
ncbi:MAG TPA: 2Fe-2S iron-sulfur cluster-binding protein [Actinomycetota bacterium]|jgi:succinate dehydrogenase / fumarate reductase iron-sulfur subunit